jgi:hypothetical protein
MYVDHMTVGQKIGSSEVLIMLQKGKELTKDRIPRRRSSKEPPDMYSYTKSR